MTKKPARRAFTLIEILLVITLIGILAGWAVSGIRSTGYRIDANVRLIQNAVIGAQQTAITRNVTVVIRFELDSSRLLIFQDADNDNALGAGEVWSHRPLFDGARFLTPTSPATTIDGAPASYLTGPGVIELPGNRRAIRIAPNGSLSGDVVVYLGTSTERPNDMRALTIAGATARTTFWSHATGVWRQRDY